jgi:hypothetical protein
MEREVKNAKGVIQGKEEAQKNDGTPYLKFKVDGKQFSMWDYEAGKNLKLGDYISYNYSEKGGVSSFGKQIVYRNIMGAQVLPRESAPRPVSGPVGAPIDQSDDKRKIVRQNAMTQSNEFVRTCQVAGLLEGLPLAELEKLFFEFAKRCENWVYRVKDEPKPIPKQEIQPADCPDDAAYDGAYDGFEEEHVE